MPAPTPATLIDRVDDADEPIGLVRRDQVFELHAGFRVAHIFVTNAAGEVLLQQVGASRERSPLRWGSSVAAYLFAQESYLQAAQRRLVEEIGLYVPLSKIGNIRMTDRGATKFIDLFQAHAEHAAIREPEHIEALRFWPLTDIEQELARSPETFTETFPYVYRLYQAAAERTI
jgi:isopentenyl-diphosphate Delta-isomerase